MKADAELQSGSREQPRREAYVELVKMSRCVEEEWASEGKKRRRVCLLRFNKSPFYTAGTSFIYPEL